MTERGLGLAAQLQEAVNRREVQRHKLNSFGHKGTALRQQQRLFALMDANVTTLRVALEASGRGPDGSVARLKPFKPGAVSNPTNGWDRVE